MKKTMTTRILRMAGGGGSGNDNDKDRNNGMYMYNIDGSSSIKRSIVYSSPGRELINAKFLDEPIDRKIESYYFELSDQQEDSVDWKTGSAYGFEFADITLPRGYLFGRKYASTVSNPVAFYKALMYVPDGKDIPLGEVEVCSFGAGSSPEKVRNCPMSNKK